LNNGGEKAGMRMRCRCCQRPCLGMVICLFEINKHSVHLAKYTWLEFACSMLRVPWNKNWLERVKVRIKLNIVRGLLYQCYRFICCFCHISMAIVLLHWYSSVHKSLLCLCLITGAEQRCRQWGRTTNSKRLQGVDGRREECCFYKSLCDRHVFYFCEHIRILRFTV